MLYFLCIATSIHADALHSATAAIPPAFVANRANSAEPYEYAITPAGWLVDCHGFAFPQLFRIGGGLTLYRWRFLGASPNCAVSELDPDGAYEHYYFGRQAAQTAEMVARHRTLLFYEAWPGVDVRYTARSGSVSMTFTATRPGALDQVRFENDPIGLIDLRPPPAGAESHTYTFALPSMRQTPARTASAPDRSTAIVFSDEAWPGLDPSTEVCKLSSTNFQSCPGIGVAVYTPKGELRSVSWFRGSRHQGAAHLGFDQGSNLYVAGSTYSFDFPVTPGKLQTSYAGPERMSSTSFGVQPGGDLFLLKLHGPSGLLIHSTLLGDAESELVQDLHIDRGGRAYLSVAFQRLMLGAQPVHISAVSEEADALVYRLAAPGDSWVHSVSQGGNLTVLQSLPDRTSLLTCYDRNGKPLRPDVPVPYPGDPQSVLQTANGATWLLTGSTLAVLDNAATPLRALETHAPPGLLLEIPGEGVALFGHGADLSVAESLLPGKDALLPAPCPGSGILLRYLDGGGLSGSTWLPRVTAPPVQQQGPAVSWIENNGDGQTAHRYDWTGESRPFLACAYAPGNRYSIAAGSVIRLVGSRIGPESPVDLPTGEAGRLLTAVQGIGATLRSLPMPIMRGDANTLDLVVPQAAAAAGEPVTAELRLTHMDARREFRLAAAALQGLPGYRGFQVLSQNGEPNTVDNPSRPGELLSFLAAGPGALEPLPPEGTLQYPEPPRIPHRILAQLQSADCQDIEAAQVEGLPPGLIRIRLRLPSVPALPSGAHRLSLTFQSANQPFLSEGIAIRFQAP